MSSDQKGVLAATLEAEGKKAAAEKVGQIDFAGLAENASNNYQIIPLTLPMKSTGYKGVNAYIDNVGRVKGLGVNARASRITSDDIRGDCFLSLTYDDEEDFK